MNRTRRFFYDCEFIDTGTTIDLISIGIVSEEGAEFYAVSAEFDQDMVRSDPWLSAHVWPLLPLTYRVPGSRGRVKVVDETDPHVHRRGDIALAVESFVLADSVGSDADVELWADYGAYDHVVLAQLFGRMSALPPGFPMFTHDLQQEARRLGVETPVLACVAGSVHHALDDARRARHVWQWLVDRGGRHAG